MGAYSIVHNVNLMHLYKHIVVTLIIVIIIIINEQQQKIGKGSIKYVIGYCANHICL